MRFTLLALPLFVGHVLAASSSASVASSVPVTSSAASSLLSSSASTIASASASTASVSSVSASSASASSTAVSSTASPISTSSSSSASSTIVVLPSTSVASFVPFPSPSSEPAIPGIYPATTPKDPPPVESPGIVPDFAQAWAAAYQKAKAKVATFSLEQKVNVTTGVGSGSTVGRCVGNTPVIGDFPGFCLEDSPLGVRLTDFATGFPTGINTATTWKRSLIRARGVAMGQEHVGKGVNVALGPMMNLGRDVEGGRNWEGFGADPFLAGEAAYETILGMQSAGVQACAKHFIDNEQETQRMLESSNVDDRTEHEIYALPFLRSVMAGTASVMCSYNQINGTYACENDRTLNQILKNEFGFQGYVMSDWGGTHSTGSANEGLDMTMPGDIRAGSRTSYFGANLTAAVRAGSIPEERVDDMATRILAGWYLLEQDAPSYPTVNFNANAPLDEATNEHVDVQDDHYKIVREIGAASAVLLKNTDGALPLKKPRTIVLIGSDAGPAHVAGPNEFRDQQGVDGILAMGWGSGTANFTYLISPYEAIQARAREDHTSFFWYFDDLNLVGAAVAARQKSAAIVFLQSDSGEGSDRQNLTALHNGDALVNAVAAVNENTIVVVHSVGPLIIEPWIDNPNVTAVVWAGVSGTETGNALTDVLYGAYNPSGRLAYTLAKDPADYPAQISTSLQIPYTEALNIDYRHFDAANITPRFEFGFGLSYTTFKYSDLSVNKITNGVDRDTEEEANWAAGNPTPAAVGTSTALWLHRPAYEVTFSVQNVGDVAGTEIPQLYLNHPASAGEPPSILKGFTDVDLAAGKTQQVTLTLSRFDLSIWDVVHQSWVKPDGTFGITVGASSRDGRLTGNITV